MNLGQVVTTISGLTLTNVNITSGNVTITNVSVTNITANNAIITGGTISNTTLTNVTITSLSTPLPNNFLANSSTTLGNAVLTLGSTTANIGNVTFANIAVQSGTIDNTAIGTTTPTTIKTTVLTVTTSSALGNATANQLNNTPIGNNSAANGTFTNLTSTVSSTLANLSSSNATITGGTIGNVTLANATISSVSNPLTIAQGGTNVSSITANAVIIGNGTSSIQTVSPGTAGNVLTSNGTNWISQTGGAVTNISSGTSNVAIVSANGNVTSYVNGVLQSTLFSGGLSLTGSLNSINTFGFKNRIINGAMVIDQRNAGAVQNPAVNGNFSVDRWKIQSSVASKFSIQQNSGSVTPPTGFTNYLGVTSLSPYSVASGDLFSLQQWIEGYNIADLGFGTANAKTITLSFQVYSSLTGTFGGALNGYNGSSYRSYPFSYSIPSANTWTQISITIAGDTTTFSYNTTNGYGLSVQFGLGCGSTNSATAGSWQSGNYASATGATSVVGTNGATFYITGTQLEVGSQATSFDFRPYGTELALCQRYFQKSYNTDVAVGANTTAGTKNSRVYNTDPFLPQMETRLLVSLRATPTVVWYTAAGTAGSINVGAGTNTINTQYDSGSNTTGWVYVNGSVTSGSQISGQFTASAEL
jgi:hypothetical protein